jgi:hypothetical protein
MRDLWNAVSANKTLERILPIMPEGAFLVGGCVRDLLLGGIPTDIDIVTFGSALELSGRIGEALGGRAFALDPRRGVMRVALEHGAVTVDCVPGRGGSIGSDLLARDITINAMAWHPTSRRIIDPTGGLEDLEGRIIRLIGERNLLEDPLRGLRCLRFAVQLGFRVEPDTEVIIERHARTLAMAAGERIKQEVFKALSVQGGTRLFALMEASGHMEVLFGGGRLQGLRFSQATARRVDALLDGAETLLEGSGGLLASETECGISRAALLRFASCLAGAGPTGDRSWSVDAAARLALSSRSRRALGEILGGAVELSRAPVDALRDAGWMYRLARACGRVLPEVLLLYLAWEGKEEAGPRVRGIWGYFVGPYRIQKDAPLLRGTDIIRELGVKEGAEVGEFLLLVEEARARGEVTSRDEALSLVAGLTGAGREA